MTAGRPPSAAPRPCPDAEQLAAWAAGTLFDAEREVLEAHLADCTECREQAFSLETEPSLGAEPAGLSAMRATPAQRSRPRRALWIAAACAAGITAALGVYLLQPPAAPERAPFEATLAALRRAEPELFGAVAAVDPASLPAPGAATRGAMRLLAPVGLVPRSGPVDVRWTPSPGAQAYRLAHVDEDGRVLAEGRTTEPAWLLDPVSVRPGARTTLEIRAEGPGGTPLHRAALGWSSDVDERWRARMLEALASGRLPRGDQARVAAVHALAGRGFLDDAYALAQTLPAEARAQRELAPLLEALARRSGDAGAPR